MMYILLLLPAVCGLIALLVRNHPLSRILLTGTAVVHAASLVPYWIAGLPSATSHWLQLDELGLLFLSLASLLFLAAAITATAYLQQQRTPSDAPALHMNESAFIGCLLLFLATMTLVCLSQNFGILWIGIEATTLASAPLIFFHRNNRSLEATWKYLLICSIGIALALMGNLFLSVSAQAASADGTISLLLPDLLRMAPLLHDQWLNAAFVFLLIGYGTKMGLAPMHTWLPDAHSEAPSLVSALLSGALLNCAFLGILRGFAICSAAGQADMAKDLLLALGMLSLLIAAIFILGQTDYKRMLAYSSVEHMGLLALGIGLAGEATFGAMYHAVNHSITKGMLFLLAGNILAAWHTKKTRSISGLLRIQPLTGFLWIAGFLAITGTPPFGTFFSEWIILREAFVQHRYLLGSVALLELAVIFMGMASIMLRMTQGPAPEQPIVSHDNKRTLLPPLALGLLALLLGIHLPEPLAQLLHSIAQLLNGGSL